MKKKKRMVYRPRKAGRLVGKSNTARDKRYAALHPGKRRSKSGKTYYESRRNRADKNKRKRL